MINLPRKDIAYILIEYENTKNEATAIDKITKLIDQWYIIGSQSKTGKVYFGVEDTKQKKGELLSKMLVLATNKHHGQFDKGGKPYILHPLKVMEFLNTEDEELQCIAVGHDLIEDTDTTYEELSKQGFTSRIIEGIRHLTNVPGETTEDKLNRICGNRDAMQVKLCDLQHNSDIRRLKGVTEKDNQRMARYHNMYIHILRKLKEK